MDYNSFKEDEQSVEKSKLQTLKRLFSYLLKYKGTIVLVLLLVGYCVVISLVNPLIMESAIDDYIGKKDYRGLYQLLGIALFLNFLVTFAVKSRMYIMAKMCNKILLTIRQELYTHIQKLGFQFFDSRPTGKKMCIRDRRCKQRRLHPSLPLEVCRGGRKTSGRIYAC